MTTQDLTNNRDRIIRKINSQVTKATSENIKSVMVKMIAMLPQFENEKATMANIDKLTMKATLSYIKSGMKFTEIQKEVVAENYEAKQRESRQSSL